MTRPRPPKGCRAVGKKIPCLAFNISLLTRARTLGSTRTTYHSSPSRFRRERGLLHYFSLRLNGPAVFSWLCTEQHYETNTRLGTRRLTRVKLYTGALVKCETAAEIGRVKHGDFRPRYATKNLKKICPTIVTNFGPLYGRPYQ